MTTNQTVAQRAGAEPLLGASRGWGFGLAVVTERDALSRRPDAWLGQGPRHLRVVGSARDLIGILTQRPWTRRASSVFRDFWTSTYQAIDD
jgi:hypothetical protein